MKTTSIFVYGTLQNVRVMETLLGKRPLPSTIELHRNALVRGYARYRVRDRVFPGMVASPASQSSGAGVDRETPSTVDGCVITGLSETDLRIFDWYEADEYARRRVKATVRDDSGEAGHATTKVYLCDTYVWKDEYTDRLDPTRPWSLEEFEREHLEWYMQHTVEPCRREIVRLGMDSN